MAGFGLHQFVTAPLVASVDRAAGGIAGSLFAGGLWAGRGPLSVFGAGAWLTNDGFALAREPIAARQGDATRRGTDRGTAPLPTTCE